MDRLAVVRSQPSRTVDPLAYEIRRLSNMLLSREAAAADSSAMLSPALAPGELAHRLASSFGLRPVDVDVALTVLAADIDHEFATLLYSVTARSEQGVLAAVLPELKDRLAMLDAVGADAPVVKVRLVYRKIIEGGVALGSTRRFRACVAGFDVLSMLPDFARLVKESVRPPHWAVPSSELTHAMASTATGVMCLITGGRGVGKSAWAQCAAVAIGGACLHIDVARAARSNADVVDELSQLLHDAALTRVPVVLDNTEALLNDGSRLTLLIEDAVERSDVKLFLVARDTQNVSEAITSRVLSHVHIDTPDAEARRQLWRAAPIDARVRDALAGDLVLTPRQIQNAIALIHAGVDPAVAAFEQLPKTHNLTLPSRTTTKLDALVLPEDTRREVHELIGAILARADVMTRVANGRGRAITAMFNGDSGTGKTFACEVIAAEVGLPLMRVNVASLVDKYIGETEKNLERVFNQARAQGGILFFDEADAIFGARTDVSRAQDRYANLETNLLLQLMESFSGVVLLTTNLKQNIDSAFLRRIMFKVYFETPEAAERERLWRSVFPREDFCDGIDFARLAEAFELTGGSIRAAALRAAFRAATARTRIRMADLVECAQLEAHGMGRVASWK